MALIFSLRSGASGVRVTTLFLLLLVVVTFLLHSCGDKNSAGSATSAEEGAFGFGTMVSEAGRPSTGERPLLVVILDIPGSPHGPVEKVGWEELIFGPTFPNIRDYFHKLSHGAFTWS